MSEYRCVECLKKIAFPVPVVADLNDAGIGGFRAACPNCSGQIRLSTPNCEGKRMRLETQKCGNTGDEGIEKHLVRVFLDGVYETTFFVIHDDHTGRLWIRYIPWRIEVEAEVIQSSNTSARNE